jgi:hypothetical protein
MALRGAKIAAEEVTAELEGATEEEEVAGLIGRTCG